MKKYNITKKYLIQEYSKNRKSSINIAKEVGCSIWVISNRLREFGIEIRTHKEAGQGINQGQKNGMFGKKAWNIGTKGLMPKPWNKDLKGIHLSPKSEFKSGEKHINYGKTGKGTTGYKSGKYCKEKVYYCPECLKKGILTKISADAKTCWVHYLKIKHPWNKDKHVTNGGSFEKGHLVKPNRFKGNYYKGVWMRSTWEIKYAKYLDKLGIKWQYESKQFDLGNTTYTPDFKLSNKVYIEIKGYMSEVAYFKIKKFLRQFPDIKLQILMQKDLQKMGVL